MKIFEKTFEHVLICFWMFGIFLLIFYLLDKWSHTWFQEIHLIHVLNFVQFFFKFYLKYLLTGISTDTLYRNLYIRGYKNQFEPIKIESDNNEWILFFKIKSQVVSI